jgi:hypothetical protein
MCRSLAGLLRISAHGPKPSNFMALAPVTNLAFGPLSRRAPRINVDINASFVLEYTSTITWTNTETANHYLEVWVTGTGAPSTVHLAVRNSDSIRIPIQIWAAQDNSTANRTVTVNVRLKSAVDESTITTATRTISLSEVGSIPTDPGLFVLSEEVGDLLLPAHSGLEQADVTYGILTLSNIGTTPPINASGQYYTSNFTWRAWSIVSAGQAFLYNSQRIEGRFNLTVVVAWPVGVGRWRVLQGGSYLQSGDSADYHYKHRV